MKQILMKYNNWWNTGVVNKEKIGIERTTYTNKILKFMKSKEIIKLTGVRRSGKTTILYQIIKELLKTEDPKKICYIQLDDEELSSFEKKDILKQILIEYQEITGINIEKEKVYFFFDEIQYIEKWDSWLKTFFDRYENLKFIISGSSSSLISKKSVEKLTGRQIEFMVFPLSFKEFLNFNNVNIDANETIFNIDMKKNNNITILSKENEIKVFLAKYINTGGFPRVFSSNEDERNTLLKQYFSDILYRDVLKVFQIRDVSALENLAVYFLKHIGEKFNFKSLSNILNVSTDTIIEYFNALKKTFLFFDVNFFSTSLTGSIRKNRKIYCIDSGLRNSIIIEIDEGQTIENIVFTHLRRKYDKIFFWSEKNECDFIVKTYEGIMPIEVKYRNEPEKVDGLIEFMRKFKVKKGFVITKDLLKQEKLENMEIYFMPLWMFLIVF